MAARRCGWDRLRECSELLYSRFPLRLKGAVNRSYVRLAILYASKAWSMKESKIERSMERILFGVQHKDRKKSKDFMPMLGLNETIDQLAMANSVHLYGHVLRGEDGCVLRMALDLEI